MANKDKKNQGGNQGGGGNNQSGRNDSEWESGDEFAQKSGNMTAEDLDRQIEEEDDMI